MAGWSARIRFALVREPPHTVVQRIAALCAAGFRPERVCPLGWTSFATSRERRESAGFFALLDDGVPLRGRQPSAVQQETVRLLADPTGGGILLTYAWFDFARVLGVEGGMYDPSFHWELWLEERGSGVALRAEHASRLVSRTPQWDTWFSLFAESARARLGAARWALDDDDSDCVYEAITDGPAST